MMDERIEMKVSNGISKKDTFKKKILLIEDEESLRLLYQEELEEFGYDVSTANNGKEALKKLIKEKPDLIILDIVMPEMDGIETLGRILSIKKNIPIILYTAHPGYQNDFMSWAADAYILKSTDLKELKEKIEELLEKK